MLSSIGGYDVNISAISGILGFTSIVAWIVVFTPQIYENFSRASALGLSVEFVIIWLAGDIFNILGAVLQNVLPTMIILAIYYTLADIVLLGQCFYYKGFVWRDVVPDHETAPLITENDSRTYLTAADAEPGVRSRSPASFRERLASLDATHLSPAAPWHPKTQEPPAKKERSLLKSALYNAVALLLVVVAGVAGYYLSPSTPHHYSKGHTPVDEQSDSLHFNVLGQIFGYICAVLYLGSRIPQLLLNYRRKSTEGLNALFFLFACLGNLTYVLSIFAFEPLCGRSKHHHLVEADCRPGEASAIYGRYILINLSWLLGSLGTLFLDFAVFVQFWIYRGAKTDV